MLLYNLRSTAKGASGKGASGPEKGKAIPRPQEAPKVRTFAATTTKRKSKGGEGAAKKNPRIPKPFFDNIKAIFRKGKRFRSVEKTLEEHFIDCNHAARNAIKYSPKIRLPNISLAKLRERFSSKSKNCDDHLRFMEKQCEDMADLPTIACSSTFYDADGNLLLGYFANHPASDKGEGEIPFEDFSPDCLCRLTESALKEAWRAGKELIRDGLTWAEQRFMHTYTQDLTHDLSPEVKKRDLRHPSDKTVKFQIFEGNAEDLEALRDGFSPDELEPIFEEGEERAGILHLVHAWYAQGHPDRLLPSRMMVAGSIGATGVKYFLQTTEFVTAKIAAIFKALYPAYYEQYKKAFEAGVFYTEDPGPFLGRAVVWKLPVKVHVDGLDAGPCVIFNLGFYEGGELLLPDLGIKLSYRPGDIVCFLSGVLYHKIADWKPTIAVKEDHSLTPGRISIVHFSPATSLRTLENKPPFWATNTKHGTAPDNSKAHNDSARDARQEERQNAADKGKKRARGD